MAYEKTNWTSTTPINATNLNKIESGIEQNSIDIEQNSNDIETNNTNVNAKIGNLSTLNTTEKTNLVGAINEINNKHNYSTEEQVIGTWFGKPYYRKIITVTNFAISDGVTLEHGIENIDEVLPMTRGSMKAASSPYQYHYPLVSRKGSIIDFVVGEEYIMWIGDDSWVEANSHKIVIYYTKTTD